MTPKEDGHEHIPACRLAGMLIIAGLVFTIAASLVFAAAYYMTEDEGERQAILEANSSRWVAASWMFAAAGVVAAVGMLLLALRQRTALWMAGAALFVVGNAFWSVYTAIRAGDPAFTMSGLWMENVFAWLSALGLLLIGLAIVRSDWPRWVGYVNLGYALLFALAAALAGPRLINFFPPQLPFIVACFMGVAALRRG